MNSIKVLIVLACFLFASCATTSTIPPQTPAQIVAEAAAVVTGAYLVIPVSNKADFVKYANVIADELELITSGSLPVPSVLEQDLINRVPANDQIMVQALIVGLSGIYALEYPKIAGNHPAVIADINALATGIRQGLPIAMRQ